MPEDISYKCLDRKAVNKVYQILKWKLRKNTFFFNKLPHIMKLSEGLYISRTFLSAHPLQNI